MSEEFGSPTPTSPSNTRTANDTPQSGTGSAGEFAGQIATPARLDEKIDALENELLSNAAQFKKERFVYLFSIVTLLDVLIGALAPGSVFFFAIVASLILLTILAQWLDFPFAVIHLSRWLALIEKRFAKDHTDDPLEPM